MRRKILEGNYYIPYKLIKSLYTAALPSISSTTGGGENRYEARIEKETVIRIENDNLKKDGYDSILVKAAVIWISPGKIIFILEPTRAKIMQKKFELNTELKTTITETSSVESAYSIETNTASSKIGRVSLVNVPIIFTIFPY